MIVYADVVFIENLIINSVILYVTLLIRKVKISIVRILISSALGSLYAVISIKINNNFIMKIILSVLMIAIIYPTKNKKRFLETIILFYLISITAGGSAIAISYLIQDYKISELNNLPIISFPILISGLGTVVGIILIMATINHLKNRISKKDIFFDVEIYIEDKKEKLKALLDTGNMLKDPLSNKPVMIATKRSLKSIIPEEILDNINLILGGDKIGKLITKRIKLIPFNSLGNEHGILIGIKSDKIVINNNEIKDVIIGIYEKEFSKTRRYDALIGIDLLYEEECNYESNRKIKK